MGMFQFDASFVMLLIMACVTLAFSVSFFLKSRALRKLSMGSRVNVFDKTFNVVSVDSNPDHRKITHNPGIWLIFAVLLPFLLPVLILKVYEIGLVSNLAILIVCLGLIMVDEASEIFKSTNILMKAFRNKVNLGKGDIAALAFLEETLSKLSVYYLVLAIIFFASFVTLPHISPAIPWVLAQLFSITVELPSFVGVAGIFVGLIILAVVTVIALFVGEIVKTKALGFPRSVPFTAMEEPFERLLINRRWAEKPPYELIGRPILEDYEVEERKMRALRERERISEE